MLDTSAVNTKDKKDATFVAITKTILTAMLHEFLKKENSPVTITTKDTEILMDVAIC